MKNIRLATVVCSFFLFSLIFAGNKTIAFNINMRDNNCKKTIQNSLRKETGVVKVKAIVQEGLLTITYNDEKTTPQELIEKIKLLGYYASPLGENCSIKPGGCLNNKPVIPNTMK